MEDKKSDLPNGGKRRKSKSDRSHARGITSLSQDKEIGIQPKVKGIDFVPNQAKELESEAILTEELKLKIRELFQVDFEASVQKQKDEIKKEGQEIKKDFLTIFGLFASFVTFLSIEVQVFKNKDNIFELLGICSITLSFVIFFAIIINDTAKDKSEWKDFKKPTYVFNLIFLFLGILFLFIGGKSPNKRIDSLENKNKSDSIEINLLKGDIQQLIKKIRYLDSLNNDADTTIMPIPKIENNKNTE